MKLRNETDANNISPIGSDILGEIHWEYDKPKYLIIANGLNMSIDAKEDTVSYKYNGTIVNLYLISDLYEDKIESLLDP